MSRFDEYYTEADAAHEHEQETRAIVRFENRVNDLIQSGAPDRATAIRWIGQAEDAFNGDYLDLEYLAYLTGMPFNYLVLA